MEYSTPLVTGRLIQRYKRFLADIQLDSGEQITAHCANTGAMTHCAEPGSQVWLWDSQNPKRKYRYSWEWVETAHGQRACINTARANQLVAEYLQARPVLSRHQADSLRIPAGVMIKEPRVEDGRLDFWVAGRPAAINSSESVASTIPSGAEAKPRQAASALDQHDEPDLYIEVKSVTLMRPDLAPGLACFPDAVTERGVKHLKRLQCLKEDGHRTMLLFAVMMENVEQVAAAADVHPIYANELEKSIERGVEVRALACQFGEQGMHLEGEIEVISRCP
jgi:sugar fermentation stimulation protein A